MEKNEIWKMAKIITDRQRKASEVKPEKVYWDVLEEEWFDWLEECFKNKKCIENEN